MAAGQESERKTSGYDALDEPIGLRQLIADFTLPPPEDDPRLRAAILEQCRTGLMVLGMIWTIAPFVLLVGFTVISALHLAGPTPLPMREIYLLEAMRLSKEMDKDLRKALYQVREVDKSYAKSRGKPDSRFLEPAAIKIAQCQDRSDQLAKELKDSFLELKDSINQTLVSGAMEK